MVSSWPWIVVIDIDGEKIITFDPKAGAVADAPSTAASEITSAPLGPMAPLPVDDCPEDVGAPLLGLALLTEPLDGPDTPLAAAALPVDRPDDTCDPLLGSAPEPPPL